MLLKKSSVFASALLILAVFCSCRVHEEGVFRVHVADGFTDVPICGAEVVIPETGERFLTGENGATEEIRIPVIPDREYDSLLKNREGRATVIVYAEGYVPYILLYARVRAGERREPSILLFPADGSLPVFTVIEAPDEEWCERLAKEYAK